MLEYWKLKQIFGSGTYRLNVGNFQQSKILFSLKRKGKGSYGFGFLFVFLTIGYSRPLSKGMEKELMRFS